MTSAQELAFGDLVRRYRDETAAGDALRTLMDWEQRGLDIDSYKRRMHAPQRRSLVRLVDFYGLMEVAATAGVIGSDFPTGFCREAVRDLNHPLVLDLATDVHGQSFLRLTSALKRRIQDFNGVVEERAGELFAELLTLNMLVEDDDDTATLLETLDSRSHERDLLQELESPERFVKAYAASAQEQRSGGQRRLQGLLKMMSFSEEFSALVTSANDMPEFSLATVRYHSKWFRHRELSYLCQQVLDRFIYWNPDGVAQAQACLSSVSELVNSSLRLSEHQ